MIYYNINKFINYDAHFKSTGLATFILFIYLSKINLNDYILFVYLFKHYVNIDLQL